MPHLTKKQINILLLLAIICSIVQYFLLTEYTLKNEYVPKIMSNSEYINLYYQNQRPKFNYFNGIWLMFGGILFFSIICILELPVKIEILKQEIKRDYYKKRIKLKFR